MSELEEYFKPFREQIIGNDVTFVSPYGTKRVLYAELLNWFGPYVANTHTETTLTGSLMTRAYRYSHEYIKRHVNAGHNDVIITAGNGMTSVINKLIRILADNMDDRLGVISFYHPDIHCNLFVKLLNDRYGIQTRGGCACAGTYGHLLLEVTCERSREITEKINHGDLSEKPGWVRWSLHPTITDKEVHYILHAVKEVTRHHREWEQDYMYLPGRNEYVHRDHRDGSPEDEIMQDWFKL